MNRKFVKIKSFDDSIKADLAKQLLGDNGIKAIIENRNISDVFPGLYPLAKIELKVAQAQAEQALQILESNEELK